MLTEAERSKLQAARNLIADPERWCQGAVWVTETESVRVSERFTVDRRVRTQWCARGALMQVHGVDIARRGLCPAFDRVADIVNDTALRLFPYSDEGFAFADITGVNDVLGHDAVLAVFDKLLADETIA